MTAKKDTAADKEVSFEKAITRLEKIVGEMEGGELNLDKMMEHFSEGTNLVKFCNKKLNEVEKKIELLVEKEGELKTETFDEGIPQNQ